MAVLADRTNLSEKIKLMHEGKILGSVLSLILYSKTCGLRIIATKSGEFRYHPGRLLTRNRLHIYHTEKIQPVHSGISAQVMFLLSRQYQRNPAVIGKVLRGEIQDIAI